jgi:hypothetical protein
MLEHSSVTSEPWPSTHNMLRAAWNNLGAADGGEVGGQAFSKITLDKGNPQSSPKHDC